MNAPMPTIYTRADQSKEARQIIKDLDVLEEKIGNIPDEVKTEKDAEIVSEWRAQANKRVKDLEDQRKEYTAPLLELKRRLDNDFNSIKERASRFVQLCDNMLRPYLTEQRRIREEAEAEERRRKEEEERAAAEAQAALEEAQRIARESTDKAQLKEAETKVAEARSQVDEIRRTPAKPKPGKSVVGSLKSKTGLQKVWKYRVVDIDKVPEEFLLPPEERVQKGKLNKIAKSQQETAFVPGIEFYFEDSIRSSAR